MRNVASMHASRMVGTVGRFLVSWFLSTLDPSAYPKSTSTTHHMNTSTELRWPVTVASCFVTFTWRNPHATPTHEYV